MPAPDDAVLFLCRVLKMVANHPHEFTKPKTLS